MISGPWTLTLNLRSKSSILTLMTPSPKETSRSEIAASTSFVPNGPPAHIWFNESNWFSIGMVIFSDRTYLASSTPERPIHSISGSLVVLIASRVSIFIEKLKCAAMIPRASTTTITIIRAMPDWSFAELGCCE